MSGDVRADWWRQGVVYQVYPRSFADHDGDGVGDLPGLTSRVPYLRELGIDAVWLSPFYPSALADGGYDVDDYRAVDPRVGTLADFDELAGALHAAGLRLIVDIVPNHTSNRHAWFREALTAGRGSDARDRYIFVEGRGPGGEQPPNEWHSVFGGSAWQRVADGQWYLHVFTPEQPDLNWSRRDVRDDFLNTLRFWSDRGADGFRVDVANGLAKDLSGPLPDQPWPDPFPTHGQHATSDRDELDEIYREWREVFNHYDPPRMAVAEAWAHPSRRGRYASADSLGQVFNFDFLQADWSAPSFRRLIEEQVREVADSGSSSTWALSNHDVIRHATRYGLPRGTDVGFASPWLSNGGTDPVLDRARGLRRARATILMTLALPGSTYLYQGEELGLHEVTGIPDAAREDPAFLRTRGSGHPVAGRDGARVPLPWTSVGPSCGFGPAHAHLPQPD